MNLFSFSRQNGYNVRDHFALHGPSATPTDTGQSQMKQASNRLYGLNAKLDFDSHDQQNDWLSVGVTTAQGWRSRQEDAHLCNVRFDHGLGLFAVFDGHNGVEIAEYAAQILPEYIRANVNFHNQLYVRALEESFLDFDANLLLDECNQQLHEISYRIGLTDGMMASEARKLPLVAVNTGCTAVVTMISRNGCVYVANIGDSRCILCVKGKAIALSDDHKPTNESEKRRIERAGYKVINGRINRGLNLSRAFGDHALKSNARLPVTQQAVTAFPDVTVYKTSPGNRIKGDNFLVLACDGIWNCMSNKQVCTLVRKYMKQNMKLSSICEQIVKRCVSPIRPTNGQIGGDNMTCMIVRFK